MTGLVIILAALWLLAMLPLLVPMIRAGQCRRALAIAGACALACIAGYGYWGAPRVVPLVEAERAHAAALREAIGVNSQRVKQHPDDLEAWLTLAQAFEDSGDHTAAAHGFKQAVLLSKGNPRIIAAYAEALVLEARGTVTEAARKSLDIALMLDPAQPVARYWHAVWLLQNDKAPEAMQEMKKLYRELPEDSRLKQRMRRQIGRTSVSRP